MRRQYLWRGRLLPTRPEAAHRLPRVSGNAVGFEGRTAVRSRDRPTVTSGLADRLVTAIAVGTYSPGERLPPERELADLAGRQPCDAAPGAAAGDGPRAGRGQAWSWRRHLRRHGVLGGGRTRGGPQDPGGGAAQDAGALRLPLPGRGHDRPRGRRAPYRRTTSRGCAPRSPTSAPCEEMIEARAVDRRLHGLVTAAARNPHLTSIGAHLTAAATLGFGAEPYAPEFLAQARAEHEELVEHIAARRRRCGGPVRRGALRAHARVDAREPAQGQGRSSPLTTLCGALSREGLVRLWTRAPPAPVGTPRGAVREPPRTRRS